MPVELYTPQTADDGTVTYVKVDSLPEEIVKEHPEYSRVNTLYTKAVEESKKFKTRAQEAEAKLQTPSNEAEPAKAPQTINEDELYAKFRDKFRAELTQEATASQQADLEIENLIKQHRLQDVDGIRETLKLAGASKVTLAESIGRGIKKFAPVAGGETPNVDSADFMTGVRAKLGLPDKT